jgi:hypothetical protein
MRLRLSGWRRNEDNLPPRNSSVPGLIVPAGEVVWRKNNLAGIELMEVFSWPSIIPVDTGG